LWAGSGLTNKQLLVSFDIVHPLGPREQPTVVQVCSGRLILTELIAADGLASVNVNVVPALSPTNWVCVSTLMDAVKANAGADEGDEGVAWADDTP
jgi:hypothetical protein